jgi:hypothetical protein
MPDINVFPLFDDVFLDKVLFPGEFLPFKNRIWSDFIFLFLFSSKT